MGKFYKSAKSPSLLLISLAGASITAGSCFQCVGSKILQTRSKTQMELTTFSDLSKVADTYSDGTTSSDWARVYTFLGKTYDVHTANPRTDLTLDEMRSFIDCSTQLQNHSKADQPIGGRIPGN